MWILLLSTFLILVQDGVEIHAAPPSSSPSSVVTRCPSNSFKAREPLPGRCSCSDAINHIAPHEMWVHCLGVRLDRFGLPEQLKPSLVAAEPDRLIIDQSPVPEKIDWVDLFPSDMHVRDLLIWDTPMPGDLPFAAELHSHALHLEHSLEHVAMRGCQLSGKSPVQQLRNYTKLYTLDLSRNDIEYIPADWFDQSPLSSRSSWSSSNPDDLLPFKQLLYLFMHQNQISTLSKHAFRSLRRLVLLALSENKLQTLEPTQLPAPGSQLSVLRLSYNEIRYLPPRLFAGLSSLTRVHLDFNRLLTIRSDVWIDQPNWLHINLLEYSGNKSLPMTI